MSDAVRDVTSGEGGNQGWESVGRGFLSGEASSVKDGGPLIVWHYLICYWIYKSISANRGL